jgi:hypothetical protein
MRRGGILMIRDLQIDENGWFAEGKFNSFSLFKGDMAILIFIDDGATVEYAEKCITHYNNLNNNSDILFKLQEYLEKFFLYMYAEWKAMGIYDSIVDEIEPIMEDYKNSKNLIKYLSKPTLCVYSPKDDGIGYGIECDCPWEPEHQCLIIIRNDELLYVGQSDGLDAWNEEEDYYCIWHDESIE